MSCVPNSAVTGKEGEKIVKKKKKKFNKKLMLDCGLHPEPADAPYRAQDALMNY